VAAAVVDGGAGKSRAFLLTELARVLEDPNLPTAISHTSVDALVAVADAHRRSSEVPPRLIADPVGASERRFLEIFEEIDRLVTVVARNLVSASIERPY
jgi:hypothetical protein